MQPLLSICMNTFNHEAYITQAIEGVLMQQTDFSYRLVIGEDLSSDNTRAICEQYAAQYPDRILLLPSDRKYGQNHNMARTIKCCTGKYIAMCEGDDYWIDPLKLQKQVDFLEMHPQYVLCFHPQHAVDQYGNMVEEAKETGLISFFKGADLFHTFVATPSMVFRNCLPYFPEEFYKVKSTDAFLCGMLSGYGMAARLNFVGACYRMHGGGCYNKLSLLGRYKQAVYTRKLMKRSSFFSKEQKREIRRELYRREMLYIKSFLKKRELSNCIKMAAFCVLAR